MEKGILKISQNKKVSSLKTFKLFLVKLLLISSFAYTSSGFHGVASRHHIATDIGLKVLKDGGNAIDAAVAVGFALSVVNPSAGNLGGGGFMLIHLSEKNETIAIDYRERAPIQSSEKMFQDQDGNIINGLSLNSTLASGVPGTVSGMFYVSEKFGIKNIKSLINPSVEIAKKGFILSKFQASNLNKYKEKFLKNPEAKEIFTRTEGFAEGDILIQENLANTLSRIAKNGKEEFYLGETAKKISSFYKKNKGILSFEDLKQYELRVLKPVCGHYRVYRICSMPPPSSGGIALIQMLNILENLDIDKFQHNSEEYLMNLISAMDYAFFDRAKYLGDPDFFNVPQELLISKQYAKDISIKIKKKEELQKIKITVSESEETTHFSIVDKWGNAVSNTYTLNTAYGSGIVPTGTGILMNNEMDDFSPLSSMTPVIVFKEDKPFLVTGSPGGSTIITAVLQELLNVLDFNMSLSESSKKSKIHFQHLPDIVFYEKLDDETLKSLKTKKRMLQRKLGEIHSILVDENNIEAFSDNRRPDGKASTIQN